MPPRLPRYLLAPAFVLALAIGVWLGRPLPDSPTPDAKASPAPTSDSAAPRDEPAAVEEFPAPRTSRAMRDFALAEKLLDRLKSPLAGEKARPNEALLTFKDAAALERFLARAGAAGFRILGRNDRLRTLRVGFPSLDALARDLVANAADYADLDANYFVYPPEVPEEEPRFAGRLVPIGNNLLAFLGVDGDTAGWGSGVTIAVLDSGVLADPTFGTGRLRFLDAGYGFAPAEGDGHGTAVASLAGGMNPDAVGTAPAATLLSIRVTGADGLSDSFTLSEAIFKAVDGGAQVINVSLGSYANSLVMTSAIDYATGRGVVVVASAGNDQASQLTWPAADPRVISVGAVDAAEQQVVFSNSGDNLSLTAPGFGLQTAWVNGARVFIDGTSASAPVVAGAIAALMSQNRGLTAMQAVDLLQRHASDGGPLGPDRNFGNGILNLGWAMNRNNFGRVDTAVSSQFFDANNSQVQFVVQNRSAQSVPGLQLKVTAGVSDFGFQIPTLGPGGTYPIRLPVDHLALQAYGRLDYRARLINPAGIIDVIPANNERANSIMVVQSR